MSGHELLTIDAAPRPLHPVETILVSAALARGRHIRACACGWIIVANNDTDAYCMFKDHLRAVREVARG